MGRVALAALAGLLLALPVPAVAAVAEPTSLVNPDGTPATAPWSEWASQMRVPGPGGVVTIRPAAEVCPGYLGCAVAATRTIALAPSVPTARWALYHEFGHQFDWSHLTDRDRVWFTRMMGDQGMVWSEWAVSLTDGAMDDFAQMYATCAERYGQRGWPASQQQWGVTHDEVALSGLSSLQRRAPLICARIVALSGQRGTVPPAAL